MHIRCLLIILLVTAISCSEWRELKVITVNKDGQFDARIQKSLQSALKWMEKAILVQDPIHKTPSRYVSKYVQGYSQEDAVSTVTVQTPNKLFSVEINSPDFDEIFDAADVVVFIIDSKCVVELPEGSGGAMTFNNDLGKQVPKLGLLQYCYHEFKEDFRYFDLFRHELIHVLGFGTVNHGIPKEEEYQWKFEDGTEQRAHRYYFNTNVTNEVKKHFKCNNLNGVESDAEGKHLDEYIFFNELMTPLLNEENFFSYISAEILEGVYLGDNQWYKVNRTFIAPEANAYSYGKGFGCTFLQKSCYEFLEERKGTNDPRPAPFCLEDSNQKCFKTGTEAKAFTCKLQQYTGQSAENGIVPPPGSKYNSVVLRYCPIFSHYYAMEKYELVPCKHVKMPF